MQGTYCVYLGKQVSGYAEVRKSGLYYFFKCRCKISGDVVYRLTVISGQKQEKIGVLVPMEDGFGLDTKVPCKRFAEEELKFVLLPKLDKPEGQFIPIYPDEPFSYIEKLKQSFLVKKYGQVGILLE